LTIHCSLYLTPDVLVIAIYGISYLQSKMFPRKNACNAISALDFLSCTNFETESKLTKISGIVGNGRSNQYPTKALSPFWSLTFKCHCSCHGRHPFSTP
jgi:hypothetical protein